MFRENKFFLKFLSQLALLILIPTIILSVYIQNYVYQKLADNAAELSESYFETISGYIEDVIENAVSSAVYMVADPQVHKLLTHLNNGDTTSVNYLRTQYVVTQQFKTLLDINKSLHSVYIYNEKTGNIITSDGLMTIIENHYDTGWLEHYQAGITPSILPERMSLDVDNPYLNSKSETVISVVLPIKAPGTGDGNAVAIVNIAKDDLFNVTLSDGFSCLIYSTGQQVISTYADGEMDPTLVDGVMAGQNKEDTVAEIKAPEQNEVYNVYYKSMPELDVVYTILTPIGRIQNTLRNVQYTVVLTMIGSIILCMFLAIYIARRYCTPIITMSRDLQQLVPNDKAEDQLHYITEAVANISSKYREMSQTDPDLIGNLFGTVQDDLAFDDGYFFCAVTSFDDYWAVVAGTDISGIHNYKKALIAEAQQTAPAGATCEGLMLDDDKTLIAYRFDVPLSAAEIEELFRSSLAETHQAYPSISIGVGGQYEHKSDLTQSYLEALDATKYRLVLGHQCVALYEEIVPRRNDRFSEQLKLSDIITKMSHEEVCAEINAYFAKLKDTVLVDSNTMYEYVLPIANDLSHFLTNQGISINSVLKGDKPVYMRLLSEDTFDEISALLCNICESVMELLTHKSDDEAYMGAIATLVDQRYNNPGLDISTIAEEVGISYSYVCKIVKDRTKLSFTNYLNRYRIRLAKEQLRESDASIRQIAESVGYVNDQSLTRYFKKFEGITPGKYRRIHQNDKSES